MASAPEARASSMIARLRRSTELVRDTEKAPPQHSTAMFHLTGLAPQARMTSSMPLGCSASSKPVVAAGRTSRQPQ